MLTTHCFGLEQSGIYGFRKKSKKKKSSHRGTTVLERGREPRKRKVKMPSGGRSQKWWKIQEISEMCGDECLGRPKGGAQQHQTQQHNMIFCQPSLIYTNLTAPSPGDFQGRGKRWTYRETKILCTASSSLEWGAGNSRCPGGIVYLLTVGLRNFKRKMRHIFVLPSYSPVNGHWQYNPGERWRQMDVSQHNYERTVTEMWTALSVGMMP